MPWTKFERLDVDTALERLRASTARVVVIGLPTSRNSSYLRASPDAPARVAAAVLREEGNPFAENGVDVSDRSLVRYLGALALETDDEFDRIRRVAAEAFRLGKHPLFIGGDHSVTYPVLAGLHEVHGPVDIVHVDAHPDLYDELGGNRLSHASPFARILEAGYARSLTQYGLRTFTAHQREQAARFGVTSHEMRHHRRWSPPKLQGPVYVSLDLDAMDPAFVPGVAHQEPGGMSVRDVLDVLGWVDQPVVAGDVVEYHPARDIQGTTATVAAKLVRELAAKMIAG
jgi:agmatinase